MTASLMPMVKAQFWGVSGQYAGKPLSGGKIYTCIPGGTINQLKNSYTDESATVLNDNPVILDQNGMANIWLYGFYKIYVYDANGVLQLSEDNVSSADATAAGNTVYVSTSAPLVSNGTTNLVISIPKATANSDGYMTAAQAAALANVGSGTVMSVSANAPLSSTGGTTPVLSMPAATANSNGYMTAAQAAALANAGNGTVLSVSANAPLSSTGGTTPVLSMPAATANSNGYMTAAQAAALANAGNGTVLSVSANAPLSSTGGTTPVLSMPAATANSNGYMTAAQAAALANAGNGTVLSVSANAPLSSTGGTTPVLSMPAATANSNGYMTAAQAAALANAGNGTVLSVSANAPLSSTGGTTPVLSMPAATANSNGYMTAAQAAALANAGNGTVLSVSANAPLSSTGGTTPVLSMPAATANSNGYMTAAQASALANVGNVSGNGTSNYLTKWLSANLITSSGIYQGANGYGFGTSTPGSTISVSGSLSVGATYCNLAAPANGAIFEGNVGIGTTSPGTKLEVNGILGLTNGGNWRLGYNADGGSSNVFMLRDQTNGVNAINVAPVTGNVGIGTTTPSTKLHVLGTSVAPSSAIADGIFTIGGSSSVRLLFGSSAADPYGMWMQVTDDSNSGTSRPLLLNPIRGNVGIGTISPRSKLDVVGDLSISGALYPANNVPTNVTSALYNNGGNLYWNGSLLSLGSNGTLTGSGTTGQIPIWSGNSVLGNSILIQSGINVSMIGSFVSNAISTSTGMGISGLSSNNIGVYGYSLNNYGVFGNSTSNVGVCGYSSNSWGIYGISANSYGVYGSSIFSNGGLSLANVTPATTANTLYNVSGALYWNGAAVGGSGGGNVSGSGTANYIPMWTGANTIGSSSIHQNGGMVAVGSGTPANTFNVFGTTLGLVQNGQFNNYVKTQSLPRANNTYAPYSPGGYTQICPVHSTYVTLSTPDDSGNTVYPAYLSTVYVSPNTGVGQVTAAAGFYHVVENCGMTGDAAAITHLYYCHGQQSGQNCETTSFFYNQSIGGNQWIPQANKSANDGLGDYSTSVMEGGQSFENAGANSRGGSGWWHYFQIRNGTAANNLPKYNFITAAHGVNVSTFTFDPNYNQFVADSFLQCIGKWKNVFGVSPSANAVPCIIYQSGIDLSTNVKYANDGLPALKISKSSIIDLRGETSYSHYIRASNTTSDMVFVANSGYSLFLDNTGIIIPQGKSLYAEDTGTGVRKNILFVQSNYTYLGYGTSGTYVNIQGTNRQLSLDANGFVHGI